MTRLEITEKFNEVLQIRGALSKIDWATKDMIYAWRTGRTIAPIGDMLGVLFELNKISINEPSKQPSE